MKQNLTEETQRMLNLMELDVSYMNQLLDKLSDGGMESLSDYEKEALQKMSTDDDEVSAPEVQSLGQTEETLRFTVGDPETGEPLVNPEDNGKTFGEPRFQNAYLQGDARDLAGFDQPIFIDGDLTQLDKPEQEQEIRMILPQGEYECVARAIDEAGEDIETYFITLKAEEDDNGFDLGMMNEDGFELGEMENYNIEEEKPSAGLSKEKKSSVVKAAKAGKDIGKPGKNFKKVADKAAKEYGSKEAGEKVAAASMWKNLREETTEFDLGEMENYNINEQLGSLVPDDVKGHLIGKLQAAIDAQQWDLVQDVIEDLNNRKIKDTLEKTTPILELAEKVFDWVKDGIGGHRASTYRIDVQNDNEAIISPHGGQEDLIGLVYHIEDQVGRDHIENEEGNDSFWLVAQTNSHI